MTRPHLSAQAIAVAELSEADRAGMFALMVRHFADVDGSLFKRDLDAKEWALLIRTPCGVVEGFTTLCRMDASVDGEKVSAFYSGDTIVAARARYAGLLAGTWIRFLMPHVLADPARHWYWFVVCKGFRTYRFLPVYFRRYIPSATVRAAADEQAILDAFATQRFGPAYDPVAGVVRCRGDYYLRTGVGDITPGRMKDPHVAHFAACNPGWIRGDELACLASLEPGNLTAAGAALLDPERESGT